MPTFQNDIRYVAVVKDGAGVGRASLCSANTSVLGTMQALIPVEEVSTEYLLHLIRAMRLGDGFNGSTIPHIYFKDYGQRLVRRVSMVDQGHIVDTLGSIERQMDIARGQLTKLDDFVKSRFAEMFGDPAENTRSWDTISLTSLGGCKNGMNFKSRESGIELPCLGVGDFKDRAFINGVSEMGRVSLDSMPAEDYFLRDGDIVFVRSNGNKELVGRCLAVFPDGEKAVYSGFCIRLRVESDQVRIPYLIWALRHPSMRRQMFGRGANVQNLNQKMMAKVMIPIPPLSRQDCFLDFAAEVDKSRFVVRN